MTVFDVKLYFIFAFISGALISLLAVAIIVLLWSLADEKREKKNGKSEIS